MDKCRRGGEPEEVAAYRGSWNRSSNRREGAVTGQPSTDDAVSARTQFARQRPGASGAPHSDAAFLRAYPGRSEARMRADRHRFPLAGASRDRFAPRDGERWLRIGGGTRGQPGGREGRTVSVFHGPGDEIVRADKRSSEVVERRVAKPMRNALWIMLRTVIAAALIAGGWAAAADSPPLPDGILNFTAVLARNHPHLIGEEHRAEVDELNRELRETERQLRRNPNGAISERARKATARVVELVERSAQLVRLELTGDGPVLKLEGTVDQPGDSGGC